MQGVCITVCWPACLGRRDASAHAELDLPQFASFDRSSLRAGIMTGAPCPVGVMKRVVADIDMRDIRIIYGMTETSPVPFQTAPHGPLERRVATVGTMGNNTTRRTALRLRSAAAGLLAGGPAWAQGGARSA